MPRFDRRVRAISILFGALLAVGGILASFAFASDTESIELPILMYHHIDQVGDDVVTISHELFVEHLEYLAENGYETVSFDELIAYVSGETVELPEKPVAIVFDDGYQSNYELAYPELKKYDAKATICVIGAFVGRSTYKATGVPMLPYFSWDAAREMCASGLVKIASHTYDMHQYAPLETGEAREAVWPLSDETGEEFYAAVLADYEKMQSLFETELGQEIEIFAYPNGKYYSYSEDIIRSLGAKVTLTTKIGLNQIVKGDPESLYLLRRYNMNQAIGLEELQKCLDGKRPRS